MSREYRELLTKSFEPEGDEQFEEKGRGRGLISGGSSKLQKRVQNRAFGMASWGDGQFGSRKARRSARANDYLATRTGRNMGGATPPRTFKVGKLGQAYRQGRSR